MRPLFKRVLLGVGGLVVVVVVAAAVAYAVGSRNVDRTYTVPVAALSVPTDSASVARGAHLASIYGCRDCHGADLSGQVMDDAPPFRVVASNLTPAGVGGDYDPPAWDRAIRHGVGADGKALVVMPSGAYHHVGDEEAAALIAYLESLPPVQKTLPTTEFKALGRLLAAGPLDPGAGVYSEPAQTSAPPAGATVAYGRYVAQGMCAYCHGADLAGQQPETPGSPYAPDLRPAGRWEADAFHQALTTGVVPRGHRMDPSFMPWTATAEMTHAEREGLRLYLAFLSEPTASASR